MAMLAITRQEELASMLPTGRNFGVSAWIQKDPGWLKRLAKERWAARQRGESG